MDRLCSQPISILGALMRKARHSSSSPWIVLFAAVGMLLSTTSASAADAMLAWDPNSEIDLAGYGVYFQKFPPDEHYDLFGYITLEELSDSSSPTFTVSGLDSGIQYQFAVTAFNAEGNESTYSTPVCAEIGSVNSVINCPSSTGGGSGGGGGGGCFIGSAFGGFDVIGLAVAVISLLWIIAALKGFVKNRAS
jgi:hypothetical protein